MLLKSKVCEVELLSVSPLLDYLVQPFRSVQIEPVPFHHCFQSVPFPLPLKSNGRFPVPSSRFTPARPKCQLDLAGQNPLWLKGVDCQRT